METLANIHAPSQKPLRDVVRERIRDSIYDGTLPPGARLVERDLASHYSVSRLPVREALRILQNEGLVERLPTRVVVVRTLTKQHVSELYDVREALEGLAAEQAARHIAEGVPNLFPEIMQEMREALDVDDVRAAHAANSKFHDEITKLSRNTLLTEMLEPLVGRVGWLRRKVEDFDHTHAEHEQLYEAIYSGNPTRAAVVARAHVRASRERTVALLFDS